jgi:hypothetical protein
MSIPATHRRSLRHRGFSLLVCLVAAGGFAPIGRATNVSVCVSTAAAFQQALTDASDGGVNAGYDVEINVVQGTYKTGAATANGPFRYHSTAATGDILIFGGWSDGCQDYLNDARLTILDGQHATQVLNVQNPTAIAWVEGFTIQNGESATAGGGAAINTETSGGLAALRFSIVRNNHTSSIGGGFAIDGAGSQVSVDGNLVVHNAADGGFGAGFLHSRSGNEVFVTFNTMYKNTTTVSGGTGGLSCCGTPALSPFLRGNIIWGNDNFGLDLNGTPADLEYNDHGTITGVSPVQEHGTLSTNPGFVDADNGNYRLVSGSPLLGHCPANVCGPLSYDLVGHAYPQTGFVDVGAFQDTVFGDGFDGR